jgi:hypothetical protein
MAKGNGQDNETGLLGFLQQLLEDQCLEGAQEALARRTLASGIAQLTAGERNQLEQEIVAPYSLDCEACGSSPDWAERLDVYDIGLCSKCFNELEGTDDLGVRPDWMPLVPLPENDDLPLAAEDDLPLPAEPEEVSLPA